MTKRSILIIGIGNRFRTDDGVGPLVADRLGALGFETLEMSGEGAGLINAFEEASTVIIVDAMRSGADLGTVRHFNAITEELPTGLFAYSSHQFGLAEAVETARTLNRLPKSLEIYAVEGTNFDYGETPSQAVLDAADTVVARIQASLSEGD